MSFDLAHRYGLGHGRAFRGRRSNARASLGLAHGDQAACGRCRGCRPGPNGLRRTGPREAGRHQSGDVTSSSQRGLSKLAASLLNCCAEMTVLAHAADSAAALLAGESRREADVAAGPRQQLASRTRVRSRQWRALLPRESPLRSVRAATVPRCRRQSEPRRCRRNPRVGRGQSSGAAAASRRRSSRVVGQQELTMNEILQLANVARPVVRRSSASIASGCSVRSASRSAR